MASISGLFLFLLVDTISKTSRVGSAVTEREEETAEWIRLPQCSDVGSFSFLFLFLLFDSKAKSSHEGPDVTAKEERNAE